MRLDAPRFTFGSYLRDQWASVAVGAFCVVMVFGMLCALTTLSGAILVAGFVAACGIVAVAAEYRRRAAFFRELEGLIDSSIRAYQALSLVDEPTFLEGREAYAALDALSHQAADEISALREDVGSYREYVELWVHEIKTPIAAAKLMLASMHGEQAAKLKGEIERIEGQVESTLYYARSSSLSNDYFIREVALAGVAQDACKRNAHSLIERAATPRIDVDPALSVLADATWLGFVVSQVVVNAAKYGAREIRFTAEVRDAGTSAERTVLEIADDGCGIAEADVPRVFDRGFTGSNGRTTGSSTGMGLYLAATLCERMGLAIALASQEGRGTRVMIAFPHDRRRLDDAFVRSDLLFRKGEGDAGVCGGRGATAPGRHGDESVSRP